MMRALTAPGRALRRACLRYDIAGWERDLTRMERTRSRDITAAHVIRAEIARARAELDDSAPAAAAHEEAIMFYQGADDQVRATTWRVIAGIYVLAGLVGALFFFNLLPRGI